MTMVSLPNILFKIEADDVGDLEFIQGKVLTGDYFQVSGDISNLNDTIEFTVPINKTAFMIEAKITIPINLTAANIVADTNTTAQTQTVADLLIDTVQKDKAKIGVSSRTEMGPGNDDGRGGSGFGYGNSDPFNVLGLSLVGDGAKKIEIENVLQLGTIGAFATMSGYTIDT